VKYWVIPGTLSQVIGGPVPGLPENCSQLTLRRVGTAEILHERKSTPIKDESDNIMC
jgi:hypothetical protein